MLTLYTTENLVYIHNKSVHFPLFFHTLGLPFCLFLFLTFSPGLLTFPPFVFSPSSTFLLPLLLSFLPPLICI